MCCFYFIVVILFCQSNVFNILLLLFALLEWATLSVSLILAQTLTFVTCSHIMKLCIIPITYEFIVQYGIPLWSNYNEHFYFFIWMFFFVWKRIEIERIKWRWANHHFHHQMEESESNKYKNVNHNANERHIKKMIRVYDTIQSAIYIYTILMWNDEINVEMWQSSTFCEIEYVYLTYTHKHKHGTNEWMKFQRKWITHARTQTNKNSMQKNKTMDRLWYIVRIKMFWLMC